MVGWTKIPQRCPWSNPGTCDCVILCGKRDFANVIKYRILRWDYCGFPGDLYHKSPHEMEAGGLKPEKDVITQAGVSMTCSEVQRKSHEPRNVGRKKRKDKEHNRADTLIFKSIRPIFQAWPAELW